MRFEELERYVASKRTAAHSLMHMSTVSPVLLEILVKESMEVNREFKYNNLRIGTLGRGSIFARYEGRFGVSGYDLEHSGYRRTFSRHKDYMLDNWMIKILPIDWPDEYKRRGTYYNTTPLGKVLAMKYWYNEFLGKKPLIIKTREHVVPPEIWSKFSEGQKGKYKTDMQEGQYILDDGRLGIEVKPDDLLISFFQFLPRLKKFSDYIKKSFRLKEALQLVFSEIDINYAAPNNRAGIEIKFRKHETHVQIIKHFRLDNPDDLGGMHNYILDSITFLFLRNLETMQKELDVKNPVIAKILEDPELKLLQRRYQQEIRKSLDFLSSD